MPHEIPLPGLSWDNLRVPSEPDLSSLSTVPLVVWGGLRVRVAPADERHPYG
jgi:hypothetical protein